MDHANMEGMIELAADSGNKATKLNRCQMAVSGDRRLQTKSLM